MHMQRTNLITECNKNASIIDLSLPHKINFETIQGNESIFIELYPNKNKTYL